MTVNRHPTDIRAVVITDMVVHTTNHHHHHHHHHQTEITMTTAFRTSSHPAASTIIIIHYPLLSSPAIITTNCHHHHHHPLSAKSPVVGNVPVKAPTSGELSDQIKKYDDDCQYFVVQDDWHWYELFKIYISSKFLSSLTRPSVYPMGWWLSIHLSMTTMIRMMMMCDTSSLVGMTIPF